MTTTCRTAPTTSARALRSFQAQHDPREPIQQVRLPARTPRATAHACPRPTASPTHAGAPDGQARRGGRQGCRGDQEHYQHKHRVRLATWMTARGTPQPRQPCPGPHDHTTGLQPLCTPRPHPHALPLRPRPRSPATNAPRGHPPALPRTSVPHTATSKHRL